MNRRRFLQSLFGAVASVSIGLKLSQGMPMLEPSDALFQPDAGTVKFKATERFVAGYADWRGVYGTPVTS